MKQLALIALFICSLAAGADALRGVVRNGTTNKPSAGDEVSLKRIGNGMEDAGQTKTNARGEFSFDVPAAQMRYVIWVKHQNVMYTQVAMTPSPTAVAIPVYDVAPNVQNIRILQYWIALQAGPSAPNSNDLSLKSDELYTIENDSAPPRTKMGDRVFEVYLPEGATIAEASAQVPNGMPLKAGLAPTGEKNQYAFKYPIRPGQTQFHIAYTLPYTGKLQITPKVSGNVDHMLVVMPGSMNAVPASNGIYTADPNPPIKNVNMFGATSVTPQQQLGFEVQGTGMMPRENEANASPAEDTRPGGGLGLPNEKPDPLHSGQWYFLGVLSLFLALGAVFVFMLNAPLKEPAPASGAKPASASAELLEAMKEEMFQLEADRLHGKLSPQEYETAKAALDKTLQRAVARQKSSAKKSSP